MGRSLPTLVFGVIMVLVGTVGFVREFDVLTEVKPNDVQLALRDGDGLLRYADRQERLDLFRSGNWAELLEILKKHQEDEPFDPSVMALHAVASAQIHGTNPVAIAHELEHAVLISGNRPDIVRLRNLALSALLQDRPAPTGTAE